jgi:hypothetical protein
MLTRMRSRLLHRIHLAIQRESERVRRAASRQEREQQQQQQSGAGREEGEGENDDDDHAAGGGPALDGAAVLNMASLRVSLSVIKAVKGVSPGVFAEFCESLLDLFQVRYAW